VTLRFYSSPILICWFFELGSGSKQIKKYCKTINKNSLAWFDETIEIGNSLLEAKECNSYGDKPLVILSSKAVYSKYENLSNLWLELQNDLLSLSSNSRQVILEDIGHYAHIENPKS